MLVWLVQVTVPVAPTVPVTALTGTIGTKPEPVVSPVPPYSGSTAPDVISPPGIPVCIVTAVVPLPKRYAPEVRVALPVPPLATGKVVIH